MHYSSVIRIFKSTLNGMASAINSTGISSIWEAIKRPLTYCYANTADTCNLVIAKESSSIGLALAWLDYCIQWLSLWYQFKPQAKYAWFARIPQAWNVLTDIIGSWDFYLLMGLVLFVEIKGVNAVMDDASEFLPLTVASLVAAIFTNVKVRRLLKHCWHGERARNQLEAVFDAFFETVHGFADARGLILTCETIYLTYSGREQRVNTLTAQLARYGTGVIWGFFSGWVAYAYSPNLTLAELLPDIMIREWVHQFAILFNGLFPPITFGVLMGLSITASESGHKEFISVAFSLLLPAVLVRALYQNHQKNKYYPLAQLSSPLLAKANQAPLGVIDPYEAKNLANFSLVVSIAPSASFSAASPSMGHGFHALVDSVPEVSLVESVSPEPSALALLNAG